MNRYTYDDVIEKSDAAGKELRNIVLAKLGKPGIGINRFLSKERRAAKHARNAAAKAARRENDMSAARRK